MSALVMTPINLPFSLTRMTWYALNKSEITPLFAFFDIIVDAYKRYVTIYNLKIPLSKETKARTKAYLKSSNPILNWFAEQYQEIDEPVKLTVDGWRNHHCHKQTLKFKELFSLFQQSHIFKNMDKTTKAIMTMKKFKDNFEETDRYRKFCITENDFKPPSEIAERMRGDYLVGFVPIEQDE